MKFKKVIAVALASLFLLSACGGAQEPAAESQAPASESPAAVSEAPSEEPEASEVPAEESTASRDIVIAVNNNFITLDTHNSRDSLTNLFNATVMEPLVWLDENYELQPNLAESWEISEDACTYTFHLLEGVSFTDGEPFNAAAVKANIDRVMDPDRGLRQARTFQDAKSIETPDEYTLVVTLNNPYMAFLSRMAAFNIVSPKALEDEEALAKHPIGTGAFIFQEWVEGDHLTAVKNPDWRLADQIGVDSITWRFVPEDGTRLAMLETGEADLIWPMPNAMMASIEGNPDIVASVTPSTICRYVTMNQNIEYFSDVRVRQALNYAIDKEAFVQVVKGGYGEALNSCLSPVLPFFAEQTPYEYDVEKAKALLAEAGYPDGFTATLWGNTETETVRGMQFINQQLAEIGVTIEVVPMEEGTLSTAVYETTPETTELQMWYVSWSATDPDNAVRSTFQSEMIPPTGANTNYYNSPIVDEAIKNGNQSTTFEDQYKYYKEAQDQIWKDAVWMFMGVDQEIIAKRAHITGGVNAAGLDLRTIGVQ
ncbi:MAG: ABC transporter substrate-binding protein [Clostridiales bacterium]|jgi:glutathione transport system substrate-binding protein|nr:ABC transporter substrate-binding protein [Clostridiales bacterium]